MKIAAVYLARPADGLAPIQAFRASYDAHAAGAPHRLIVIYKGADSPDMQAARAAFADLPHDRYDMEDEGYDIGAYIRAARHFDVDYMCFLNTFSQILHDGWLDRLVSAAARERTGMAAATGSYESLAQTYRYVESVIHEFGYNPGGIDPARLPYVEFIMRAHAGRLFTAPGWLHLAYVMKNRLRALRLGGEAGVLKWRLDSAYAPGGRHHWTLAFGGFPNPHLRSNAFAIRRDLFNQLNFAIPKRKLDANAFESGPEGISSRLRAMGLDLLVVGADGEAHAAPDWPRSGTYRSSAQRNLLIADNQTRTYDMLPEKQRLTYQVLTWGEAMVEPRPTDFPAYGLDFQVP